MGTFSDVDGSPGSLAAQDHAITGEPGKVQTDVQDVFADGEKLGMPVFKVDPSEFDQNLQFGRKRVQFKSGSNAQQYMQKTQYNRPFWVSTIKNGEEWTRKIK